MIKTIKIIMLLATISLFTSVPYDAVEARDCSHVKKLHEKLMCQTGLLSASETKASSGGGSEI